MKECFKIGKLWGMDDYQKYLDRGSSTRSNVKARVVKDVGLCKAAK
jgi:hypothetical protein